MRSVYLPCVVEEFMLIDVRPVYLPCVVEESMLIDVNHSTESKK